MLGCLATAKSKCMTDAEVLGKAVLVQIRDGRVSAVLVVTNREFTAGVISKYS
jgi:hypothetical protein